MIFKMPSYEVKYCDQEHWEKVSETQVLARLQETYSQVTPEIKKMIEGKQVSTRNAVYRISGYDYPYFG